MPLLLRTTSSGAASAAMMDSMHQRVTAGLRRTMEGPAPTDFRLSEASVGGGGAERSSFRTSSGTSTSMASSEWRGSMYQQ